MSFLATCMPSSKDCPRLRQLWRNVATLARASCNVVCALPLMPSSVLMMSPLWPSRTAAAVARLPPSTT
eukprot:11223786-Lingulodinium_polyedra.AAC.1